MNHTWYLGFNQFTRIYLVTNAFKCVAVEDEQINLTNIVYVAT